MVLTGEPGIGKSHIALALEERIRGRAPHITLRLFCSAHHTNSALFPVHRPDRTGRPVRARRFPRGKLAKLETLARAIRPRTRDRVALLATFCRCRPMLATVLPETEPAKAQGATLAALLAQLEGLAAQQPVLMIFEDAHWIDPTSLELLAIAVERVPRLPVAAAHHREAGVHAALAESCACERRCR